VAAVYSVEHPYRDDNRPEVIRNLRR
jgi:hypothetical protein